jgi:hypothetical protein
LKNLRERKYFISFLSLLYNCIHDKIEIYLKDRNRINFTAITNYIIFFMILFLNVSDTGIFIKTIFEEGTNFFKSLIKLIEKLDLKDKNSLFGILNNLFLDDYKLLYFKKNTSEKDDSLEMLFINNQIYFSNIYFESEEGFGDKEYRNMFNKLSRFEFSYDNFFKDKNIDNIKDKSYYKLIIAQSIIRVVFSKEKYLYIDESSKTSKYFEYYFIKNLIDKDLEITQKKYGNDISIIFRKEDIFDDIIKYIFYIFGNMMMIESFVKPVEKMLKKIGLDEESIENNILVALDLPLVRDINKEEFEILIKEISESLNETMPLIIKIILKFLYNSLIKYYKIDKNNFNPLYTALFFNYIISPKTQEMFEINPMKILLVRSLNKLVKNTCFKYKINEADNLSKFNALIEKYNINMKNLIINNVIQLDENEESNKKYMKQLFSEINLVYPKFLFYRDSILISKTFNGVSDEFINYREL